MASKMRKLNVAAVGIFAAALCFATSSPSVAAEQSIKTDCGAHTEGPMWYYFNCGSVDGVKVLVTVLHGSDFTKCIGAKNNVPLGRAVGAFPAGNVTGVWEKGRC